MNFPICHVGQRVEVTLDDGSRALGSVVEIEAAYEYRVALDPMPGFRRGGEIPFARWQEDPNKPHSIRAAQGGEGEI